jgi:hypothetical protein
MFHSVVTQSRLVQSTWTGYLNLPTFTGRVFEVYREELTWESRIGNNVPSPNSVSASMALATVADAFWGGSVVISSCM